MANAHTPSRAFKSRSCLFESLQETIDDSTVNIAVSNETISRELEKVERLRIVSERGISEEVQAMSAFDSLQALADGKQEKTRCPICLDYLGNGSKTRSGPGTIAMTKCGHLYCMDCLLDSVKHQNPHHSKQCPSCRKEFDIKSDVVHVDPQKKEDDGYVQARRDEAKRIVKDAYRLLEASNGQLDHHMWEQLYRSIDIPEGVDRSRDIRVSVLPRAFLAHLRFCTGMPVHCNPSDKPSSLRSDSSCLSSKIKALLRDLPGDERSVVFASSRNTIKHLEVVFSQSGIGHRALFSGQAVTASEHAVIDWQSSGSDGMPEIPYPVLIVQSGAAASGLTLTAACKMFMLEPFVRYEEEKQAYARIHRMGQKKECHCKIYYAPVSVESRLLEWRKLAASDGATLAKLSSNQDPSFVYSSTIIEEEPEMDKMEHEDNGEEHTQTAFLLGLHNKTDDESEESSEA
jgi:SNF2 family DNA or RNA helicase